MFFSTLKCCNFRNVRIPHNNTQTIDFPGYKLITKKIERFKITKCNYKIDTSGLFSLYSNCDLLTN